MRRPQDKLGQRQLVYELSHAIDRCVRKPWDTTAAAHLDRLLADNPRSSRSGHVLYNIGVFRRAYLERRAPRGRALPSHYDPHSLEVR